MHCITSVAVLLITRRYQLVLCCPVMHTLHHVSLSHEVKVGLLWSSYLNTEVLLGFTIFISWSLSVAVLGSVLTSQLFLCLHLMFLKGLAVEYSTDNLVVFQLITSGDFLGYFTWSKVSVQCNLQLTFRTEICIQTHLLGT